MKERPILFSGPMVRAILDGRKTQTRRIVKPRHDWEMSERDSGDPWPYFRSYVYAEPEAIEVPCPYGVPGDRLWVRETWAGPLLDEEQEERWHEHGSEAFKRPKYCVYRATDQLDAVDEDGKEMGWTPSIHMPRWASRLTLEVVNVRVERLQEISEADCTAEGMMDHEGNYFSANEAPLLTDKGRAMVRGGYHLLWDSINAKRAPWASNPWVWVIEFRRAP